jgi:cytidylate kinase
MESKELIIAIDGYSSCGKSTLAKQLAKELNYIFIDSGAMYRAVTLFFISNSIDHTDEKIILNALSQISIHFEKNNIGEIQTFLNNENVENKIRSIEISNKVSEISAISAVRKFLVIQQQKMGVEGGIIMDGRDIGTVVFPNADLKIFVTAENEIRIDRRYNEMLENGSKIEREEIKKNILQRDFIDTTRKDSPLKQAKDAKILDNSHLNKAEQLAQVLVWVNELKNKQTNK